MVSNQSDSIVWDLVEIIIRCYIHNDYQTHLSYIWSNDVLPQLEKGTQENNEENSRRNV